jgi:hypothetical protein
MYQQQEGYLRDKFTSTYSVKEKLQLRERYLNHRDEKP